MSIESHLEELHPAYRVFAQLTDPRERKAAAELLDFLLAEQISIPADFAPTASLAEAVKAAQPDRKCIAFLLKNAGKWTNPTVLENLPVLAPAILDLGEEGMKTVTQAAEADVRTVPAIASYSMTNKEIIHAAVAIALYAAQSGQIGSMQKLFGACPAALMETSKDAEHLLPAAAKVTDALAVVAALASLNISTARGTCLKLAKVKRTPEYLADFLTLVESIGIQCVGFCVDKLPGLTAKTGSREFVETAAAIAREYGVYAGQAYLEGRTNTSKRAL